MLAQDASHHFAHNRLHLELFLALRTTVTI